MSTLKAVRYGLWAAVLAAAVVGAAAAYVGLRAPQTHGTLSATTQVGGPFRLVAHTGACGRL